MKGRIVAGLFVALGCGLSAASVLAETSHESTPVSPVYISLNCPTGEVTLMLGATRTFTLQFKPKNAQTTREAERASLSGTWEFSDPILRLRSASAELTYRREWTHLGSGRSFIELDSLRWISSTKPTFADTYVLADRKTIDRLLAPPAPK